MTLFGAVREARVEASIENPAVPLTATSLVDFAGGGASSAAGKRVSETSALNMSAVWRAVQLNAGVSASLPFHAFKRSGEHRIDATSQAAQLLDDPHPDMTPIELWEQVYVHLNLWGNSYSRKLRDGLGIVRELWPIHPGRVKVGRESETGQKVFSIDGGREVHVGSRNILHVPGMGYDGITGVSPVRAAKNTIGLALAAEEFGSKLFSSGALAAGILQTEQRLSQKQADALASRWKAKHTGMGSAYETVILDRGAKFEQLTIPPEDAQFLESRHFQITEICRWYGIPPFLMYETEKSTSWGTGLEQQALGWVTYDLRRSLARVEQRVTKEILPTGEYSKYAVEGLLRGDSKARAAFYTAMWNLGALNTDEIRALEDRGPVEGGQARYRPLNMGQLGEFDSEPVDVPEQIPAPDDQEVTTDA